MPLLFVVTCASHSVNLGFIPQVESYQNTLKNGIHSFPAWHSVFKGCCVEQTDKFARSVLRQGTSREVPTLCGRQVAQAPRKWQLPSEWEHPVQKTATLFAFS